MGSREDFFGGYDYKAQAGIIHYRKPSHFARQKTVDLGQS
jgi:hypothetical protein